MESLADSCAFSFATLRPPRLRAGIVRRERLFSLLERGARGRLVVVKSPAGFGKTTLLADWLESRRRPYAWLGVDGGGLDEAGLLARFALALREGGLMEGEGEAASLPAIALSIEKAAGMGSGDAAASGPFVFVVDDCHQLADQGAIRALLRLAEAFPPGACLVLAGRGEPSFPVARLRASGDLVEIGATELRFTSAEVRDFLRGPFGASFTDDEAALIGARTEGWAAAIQMAVLGLRDRKDRLSFLAAFSGARRDVFDYFAEETFSSLDQGILAFLLECSILETLSAPLCSAITGREDSQALLERLESLGLFLVPLDDERRSYAFHGLFREALLRRLQADRPAEEARLRLAAADWLASRGRPVEAMRQRLLAGDAEGAAVLAEGRALAALEEGKVEDLSGAIAVLPREAVESRPWLAVAAAWAALYSGRLSDAAGFAAAAAARAEGSPRVMGHVEAIGAYRANLEGDGPEAKARALRAFELLPPSDRVARAHAGKSLGYGLILLKEFEDARRVLETALADATAAGSLHIRILAANDLAFAARHQGSVAEAEEICRREIAATSVQGKPSPVSGCLHSLLASILLSRGEAAAALEYVRLALELGLAWGNMDRLVFTYSTYVSVQAAIGDKAGARATLARVRSLPDLTSRHALLIALDAAELDPTGPDASQLERLPEVKDEDAAIHCLCVRARVLIARRRFSEALALARSGAERARTRGAPFFELEALVSSALALKSLGRGAEARAAATEAVSLAEKLGDVAKIAYRGEACRAFLAEEGLLGGGFGARLATAFETFGARAETEAGLRSGEPLSPREREILSLLVQGRTAEEIASLLFVAPSTVRTHVKSLYAKLGVHHRVEAVNKARELGIL